MIEHAQLTVWIEPAEGTLVAPQHRLGRRRHHVGARRSRPHAASDQNAHRGSEEVEPAFMLARVVPVPDHDALVTTDAGGGWFVTVLPDCAGRASGGLADSLVCWPEPSAGSRPAAIWAASPPVSAAAAASDAMVTLIVVARADARRLDARGGC
jgi:hypothetical protein